MCISLRSFTVSFLSKRVAPPGVQSQSGDSCRMIVLYLEWGPNVLELI